MNFMKRERETLERLLPGLDEKLAQTSLDILESKESPALNWFRQSGGTSLLISKALGGREVSVLDMLRIQRALGSRSPSLALATNMHTCSVVAIPKCEASDFILRSIAQNNLFIASGFAEGKVGTSIQKPAIEVERIPKGLRLNGYKRPCSLARTMDIFTASALISEKNGENKFAIVTVPANTAGITVKPFGNQNFLAGAENMEVHLENVIISEKYVSYLGDEMTLSRELSYAFLWFELFVSASYLGTASLLLEKLYQSNRGSCETRMSICSKLEMVMMAIEAGARSIMDGDMTENVIARSLIVRFEAQQIIVEAANCAAEQLGGIEYLSNFDVPYLLTVIRALAFHPPSKWVMSPYLDKFMQGNKLYIP
ncbi:hypothetical protein [Xenorhabdus taiwanensis]|uniref:Acyl-CoA dehydrogenase family protein n=1 Tax=Xenorhabdus taiwanensis TaxID=3085177 RepID=A0ABM8JTD2_9GAMM|nr:acyl-CoA dehydrogenase family protein [Xenorhabdus sp. TCT-1]